MSNIFRPLREIRSKEDIQLLKLGFGITNNFHRKKDYEVPYQVLQADKNNGDATKYSVVEGPPKTNLKKCFYQKDSEDYYRNY